MTKYLYPAGIPLYILSPHLDDAAFSLGSFMATHAVRNPIKVINLFTAGDVHPPTLSARAFLSQIGVADPIQLFKLRRKEDKVALRSIGVTVSNWGAVDALWRRHSSSSILPELGANYPTYRLHVSRGRVSTYDQSLIKQLKNKLRATLPKSSDYRVIVPLGHGGHVDHTITRLIGEAMVPAPKLSYYLDFPYSIRNGVLKAQLPTRHKSTLLPVNAPQKLALCKLYASQFSKVIPNPSVLSNPETLYVFDPALPAPKADLTTHLKAFCTSPKNYLFTLMSSSSNIIIPPPRAFSKTDKLILQSFIKHLLRSLPSTNPQAIGSTALGIAGRGDLDILIPITHNERAPSITLLTKLLGRPSHQNAEMTQWKIKYQGRAVDLDLIREDSPRYHEQNYLFSLLSTDPVYRREYEVLKHNYAGARVMDYELMRIIFADRYLLSQKLQVVPNRLGRLELIKPFTPDPKFPGSYLFGEYRDKNRNSYVAKLYIGSALSRAATFLRSEAHVYQQLKPTAAVITPALYTYQAAHNFSYLILTKVMGHDLTRVKPKSRVSAITACIDFLHAQPRLRGLPRRSASYWLVLFPILILLNLLKKNLPTSVLRQLVFESCKQFIWVLFRPLALVHRDLNYQNCFVTKKGLALIDYQLAAYADPLLEYAVILLKYYPDTNFTKSLIKTKKYQQLVKQTPHGAGVLSFYLTIIGLYDLVLSDGRHAVSRAMLTKLSENRISL